MFLPWSKRGRIHKAQQKKQRELRIYRSGEHHLACSLAFLSRIYPDDPLGDNIRAFMVDMKGCIDKLERSNNILKPKLDVKPISE